jgi:DNA-binding transcriptional ArsR family regulator
MTGRVPAVLLFTEQESITAGEIGERLGASAGSVSTALKSLGDVGLVERVPAGALPLPGRRLGAIHVRPEHDGAGDAARRRVRDRRRRCGRCRRPPVGDRARLLHHLMRELPAVIDCWRQGRKAT